MFPFTKCPICSGEVVTKKVEKLLRGGNNTTIVKVTAEVCLRCGERLYSKETIEYFEQIRSKLAKKDVSDFKPVGKSYEVVD
jgi:YgiT-type zinc finger domain-containing protein